MSMLPAEPRDGADEEYREKMFFPTPTPHALKVAREISRYFPTAEAQEISLQAVATLIDRERDAARREAIEECAKIAEDHADYEIHPNSASDALAEIRALLAPETNNNTGGSP